MCIHKHLQHWGASFVSHPWCCQDQVQQFEERANAFGNIGAKACLLGSAQTDKEVIDGAVAGDYCLMATTQQQNIPRKNPSLPRSWTRMILNGTYIMFKKRFYSLVIIEVIWGNSLLAKSFRLCFLILFCCWCHCCTCHFCLSPNLVDGFWSPLADSELSDEWNNPNNPRMHRGSHNFHMVKYFSTHTHLFSIRSPLAQWVDWSIVLQTGSNWEIPLQSTDPPGYGGKMPSAIGPWGDSWYRHVSNTLSGRADCGAKSSRDWSKLF